MSNTDPGRSADQLARERVMTQVSDVLLNLEHTIARARKGKRVAAAVDAGVARALADLVKDLDVLRKQLTQRTYFAAPTAGTDTGDGQ